METIFNLLPFLLFLICPISMIFMHKRHNQNHSNHELIMVRNETDELQKEIENLKSKMED